MGAPEGRKILSPPGLNPKPNTPGAAGPLAPWAIFLRPSGAESQRGKLNGPQPGVDLPKDLPLPPRLRHRRLGAPSPLGARGPRRPLAARPRRQPPGRAAAALPGRGPLRHLPDDG